MRYSSMNLLRFFFPPSSSLARRRRKQLIPFVLLLVFGASASFYFTGKVIEVADGDTIVVYKGGKSTQKIRLYGIDCPELQQRGGDAANEFSRSLSLYSEVKVSKQDVDQYGRIVGIVTLPDGTVLNEELLRSGHAWVYTAYCSIPQCADWRELEKEARLSRIGLWKDRAPEPPWSWRKKNRKKGRSR